MSATRNDSASTRRGFLKASTATLAATLPLASSLYAGGTDVLRVGLIGCGGRGTGAASQALNADKNVKLVALGDAFEDRLQSCLEELKKDKKLEGKIAVTPAQCFVGFDAYKQVIAASDVVLLTTPPHFRPRHLQAAIDAGKHVFAEKPCAVDAAGVRSVLDSCAKAKTKGLSVVSGLCLRSYEPFRETLKRLHDGAIGDIHTLQANDYRSGRWNKSRKPDWSDMTYQMRNWYNFTWLSGDFNVEQHVHHLDMCAWMMKDEYPIRAVGMGGRQVLTGPEYGNIYDHFSVVYEYANGAKLFSNTRQQPRCKNDMSIHAAGSKGRVDLAEGKGGQKIRTSSDWSYDGPINDLYQTEHDEMFAAIRASKPINNGDYMAKSTLLAIMGRMAAYTGQMITWEMALKSKENLSPPAYAWDVKLAEPPVAMPGTTKFS